eukprot:CCRYP_001353-RA/>CCRYP_001353-RA protein AED:0.15 eAED:0.15 QI:0/0/0/1/0.2/0.16/6/0/947
MQLGVTSWARKAIVGAVDEEWISEIRNPHVGFNHLMPSDLLTHLEAVGGELDFMDVTELQAELLKPWDQVEAPTTLFERQDKIEKQLVKAGIPAQHELRLATRFDSALELWEAKPTANKTLSAFRVYIQKEFAKRTKRDKQTAKSAGRGIANAVNEEELNALAMAEIVNAVQAQNNAQMEKMMEMFKASMEAMTKQQGTNTPAGGNTNTITKCPHCNLRHPKPDNCWELEKNASKRPQNWKPAAERKKARQDGVHNTIDCCVAALLPSKTTLKWARRLARWRTRRKLRTAEEALLDSGATSSFVQSEHDVQLTGKSDKMVRAADGGLMPASSTGLLALTTLRQGAREALVVPGLKPKALMSVSPLANNGYTTIFHPHDEGVTVHDTGSFNLTLNSPPVLQGCRNGAGLWTVPLVDDATISQSLNVEETALSVYDLPSTREVVRFLHAALGFPTAALLAAARNGNLYVMIAVELGGNYIDAEPLKTRKAKDLTKLTNGFTSGGRQQESFAPTGTYSTTKRLKNSSKQFPKPILKPPTHAVQEDSIAARLKARRAQQPSGTNITKADDESIAERLLRRKRQLNQTQAAFPVLDPETGQLLEYRQLLRHPKFKEAWNISAANEFGRLAQGIKGRVKATDTIKFIPKSDIPPDRLKDVTYIKFVCQVRTEKDEPNRTRATFGGNLIHYPDDVGTPTADLLLIKIFLNSVISTPGARFATADLSNFYLCTPMPRPEFGRVKLSDIPEEIIEEYKLRELATKDEWVYFRADKTHYGLPQAGSLSHDLLEKRLNAEGYVKTLTVPGLWKHKTRNIQFVLVVDDFGIKYVKKEDLDHLVGVLKAVLRRLIPKKRQDSPYPHTEPKYGAKVQFAEYDDSPDVGKEGQTHIQRVNGKFLWYGRAVDPTTLVPLKCTRITAVQANAKHDEQIPTVSTTWQHKSRQSSPTEKRHDPRRP